MATSSISGPRRLVLQNLQNVNAPTPIILEEVNNSTVPPGNVNLYSFANPGLTTGDTYTASFQQTITIPNGPVEVLKSQKQFKVAGSPYILNSSLINSVYPPAGHSDLWNVLPHVLFNDSQAPWMLQGTQEDTPSNPTPWLALLVFTEDELTLQSSQLESIESALGIPSDSRPSLERTPNFSYNVQVKDLVAINSIISQPVPITSGDDSTQIQAIFLQGSLFANLFGTYDNPAKATANPSITTPSLARFKYMSHVRRFNASGLATLTASGVTELAATISPRTGPPTITTPQIAYAHLVSLVGIADNANLKLRTDQPAALVSLCSWSFTYNPPLSYATKEALAQLGSTIQPLRMSDATLQSVKATVPNETPADSWVKNKMLSGYNLMRYVTPTGEPAAALSRSFLTPVKFDAFDFPPSSYGSDLAIVDEQSGLMDLTYSLAWELGRTMAVSDRVFAAALMRLRQAIHTQNLEAAKAKLDATYMPATQVVESYSSVQASISIRLAQQTGFIAQRWLSQPLGTSSQQTLSFQNQAVRAQYQSQLSSGISKFAQATPPEISIQNSQSGGLYDETNTPESSDYATVLSWIMDKWFLQDIPYPYLIMDPGNLPKESVRSFYVDQNWFKVFVDGVLSIAEHYDEGDDVREAIKTSLTRYLSSNVQGTSFPPQIPKWGLFIRSEFVTKFPDMRVSAPFADTSKIGKQVEVLRMQALDTDLMLLLFDREPADFSDSGITLSPPEHQLSSMFGDAAGVDTTGKLSLDWKNIALVNHTPGTSALPPTVITLTDPGNAVWDPNCRTLCPQAFSSLACKITGIPSGPSNAQVVGSQLIAMVPSLQLTPLVKTGLQATVAIQSSLSTSRTTLSDPLTTNTPLIQSGQPTSHPYTVITIYAAPICLLIKAIAKLNIYASADQTIVSQFFQLNTYYQHGPPSVASPQANMYASGSVTLPGLGNQCCLSTPMLNLRYPDINYPQTNQSYQTAIISLFPLSLGFATDLYIPMVSLARVAAPLTSVSIAMSVGANPYGQNPTAFLAPFPVNKAVQATRNASGEWPLQPNYSGPVFNGVVLPNVRSVGVGRRWNVLTAYANNMFTITLVPNRSPPDSATPASWDISQYQDLGIVVEGVQINCYEGMHLVPPGRPVNEYYSGPGYSATNYTIPVTENYWNSGTKTIQTINGRTTVTVYGISVTSSTVTPPWQGPIQNLPVP